LIVGLKPEKLYSASSVGREVNPLGVIIHGHRHKPREYQHSDFFLFCFEILTASTPNTSGMHTDGGAVIRNPKVPGSKALPQWTME